MSITKMSPFLKWAGGKGQLVEKLIERMPKNYGAYYEPFIGGGALLLNLAPQNATINDTNEQLINIYLQLKTDAEEIINLISQYDSIECNKEHYLFMREKYNGKISRHEIDAECAALMIWLNKHCFNGLYRVNGKGLFNVPYNNKVSGKSMDEGNLRTIGDYLRESEVKILLSDFEEACKNVVAGDFVYFDSPYVPVSETASFTDYTKEGFRYEDHVRLSHLYKKLSDAGVYVMLSNHDVPLVRELYSEYKIEAVDVRRNINRNADSRKGKEVIITNY